jgi:heterodisulfide reductase subunit A2
MEKNYDALVIGGGISGQEAALSLANLNYKVLLVEKDYSIGGKMILLSKVFPTLDCAACIATPKVSEVARNPNIDIYTHSEVYDLKKNSNNIFTGILLKKPRYVREQDCTGCPVCEDVCPVVVEDEYQYGFVGRKAAFIPFDIASPRIAAIDIDNCILCGVCEKKCPANCIDFTQKEEKININVKSIILATGFNLFDPRQLKKYGYGQYKNVVTSMEMERHLSPTRPYNNVLRPKDGKMPDNIAYVLCTGSRDQTVGNPICSQVCCMYSIKQAQLALGALPMADVTIYYIDIRAFGKDFEEFYQRAKGMGVEFVKGKIGEIQEKDNGDLILKYEDFKSGGIKTAEHDLVVLSVGILANQDTKKFFNNGTLQLDTYNYVKQTDELLNPAKTSIEGVFVAGTASGPMDIPDSISSAGAAAAETASYLNRGGWNE